MATKTGEFMTRSFFGPTLRPEGMGAKVTEQRPGHKVNRQPVKKPIVSLHHALTPAHGPTAGRVLTHRAGEGR